MNLTDWFLGRTTVRGRALSFYNLGMGNANQNDPVEAIENYTIAIELPEAPADVVAMAMFNRALAQIAVGEFAKGVEDLEAVLGMPGAPEKVKRRARQKMAKRESLLRRNSAERSV